VVKGDVHRHRRPSKHEQYPRRRGLYDARLDELISLVERLSGHEHDPASGPRKFVAVPG
jgi:hypothetical protein